MNNHAVKFKLLEVYPRKFSKINFSQLLFCILCIIENNSGKSKHFVSFHALRHHVHQKHRNFYNKKLNLNYHDVLEIIKANENYTKEFEK